MHIALRERNRDAVFVQSIVDQLFGTVNITDALRHKHLLLHGKGDRTVVHLLQRDGDAALRVHNVATKGVLVLQRLQGLSQQFTHTLDVGAIGHAYRNLDELLPMVARKVTEVLGKQGGVEERHLCPIDGLNLRALVANMSYLASDAVADNPVADTQTA